MNEQLTARQLIEWEVYDRIDPIGEHRGDFRMAVLASTLMNIALSAFGGGKGKPKPKFTSATDFIPKWGEKEKKETAQDVGEKVRNVFMNMVPKKRKRKRKKE